jgi:hypothetical protein
VEQEQQSHEPLCRRYRFGRRERLQYEGGATAHRLERTELEFTPLEAALL